LNPSDSSDLDGQRADSSAFELLHERVKRWIWEKQWTELRDAQERAIPSVLARQRDLVIAAATAAGKTEAAFLPICSQLVGAGPGSVRALYVSPLKALINDQFRRLEELCEALDIPVHRWHGDVSAQAKRRVLDEPSGILLITPESLEALFVNHGYRLSRVFPALDWTVLDELHAYIGRERGRQLQSLLHRLETVIGRRVMRIGLSATLGDMALAADYLRPSGDAEIIVSKAAGQELRLQIRGYQTLGDPAESEGAENEAEPRVDTAVHAISRHLLKVLRGTSNLVFANSRRDVETFADLLRRACENQRLPNEFVPHHGNLSKEIREDVESRLKDTSSPTTAICTSTLEMGIDIGQVSSIAQIRAPFSVSALRQRLGRSGRRGEPAVLRVYITEREITENTTLLDQLRPELVQSVAMTELLLDRWCEPPDDGALHLSTLVQQILSIIAERGGVQPAEAWRLLCETGPFAAVDEQRFAHLLRAIGKRDLIMQSDDGTLLHGEKGEKIVGHFSFYSAFATPEEFRVVYGGHVLGSLSSHHPVTERLNLILAGRRWRVVSVDPDEKTIVVEPAGGGRVPYFEGGGGQVHDKIRLEMQAVYESTDMPAYLNTGAQELLLQARRTYVRLGLDETPIVRDGRDTIVFLCRGDRITTTVAIALVDNGLGVATQGPVLLARDVSPSDVREHLAALARKAPLDVERLATTVTNKQGEKYDWALDDALLSADYASRALDGEGAARAIHAVLEASAVDR